MGHQPLPTHRSRIQPRSASQLVHRELPRPLPAPKLLCGLPIPQRRRVETTQEQRPRLPSRKQLFVDRALREVPVVKNAITRKGYAYLHKSRIPLSEVDFDGATDYDSYMMDECEGLCGI